MSTTTGNFGYFLAIIQQQSLPTLLLSVLIFYTLSWLFYTRILHPYSNVPGPFLASITRLWLARSVLSGKAEHTQRALHKKYGPLVRIAPNEVSVADPQAIRVIYNIKSGFTKTNFYPPFAPGISPHGDHFSQMDERKHAERRRFVNATYSMSTILEGEKYIDDCGDVFMEKMARLAKTGEVVDFGEWIQWYTFDVVGELFFGHQFGFMKDEHDYGRYIESLDTLLPGITMSCVLPPYLRTLNTSLGMLSPTVRASVKGFDSIRAAGRYWTDRRQEQMEKGEVNRVDLLDKFFRIKAEKQGWDIPDIQNEACVAIFAGSDTTAVAMRSIFYHLMKTPHAMKKLVAEIDDFDRQGKFVNDHIAYNEAIKMPYLAACCKEGMRVHPSVGLGMPRHVPAGGATIAGRHFREGDRVSINAAVVHFDKTVFGEDADCFNPDRWLSGDAASMDKMMLHFGGGSRTCIGKNISLAEMHKLIPTFLRKFEVRLADPDAEWETHNFWFNVQKNIKVHVKSREQ